jgi:NAD(P)H-dependent flavin oxidoreductase YrpB (nitropropane dioxygenase family)
MQNSNSRIKRRRFRNLNVTDPADTWYIFKANTSNNLLLTLKIEDLRKEIRRCRTMTSKPFGVNLTLLPAIVPPDNKAYAQVIIDEGVKIAETAGYSPGEIIKQLQTAGIIIIHKCTTIKHALSAEKLGVDFLSIDGFEAAGHIGETDIPNTVLLRRAAQFLKIPFVASGRFADREGLAAALAMGACGVNMGTRFMSTVNRLFIIILRRRLWREVRVILSCC